MLDILGMSAFNKRAIKFHALQKMNTFLLRACTAKFNSNHSQGPS